MAGALPSSFTLAGEPPLAPASPRSLLAAVFPEGSPRVTYVPSALELGVRQAFHGQERKWTARLTAEGLAFPGPSRHL
jgi:hypothetical protein